MNWHEVPRIESISSIQILDSRGNPTLKTKTVLSDGSEGWAAVPSGASTGKYEAVELRDGDEEYYHGLGVLKAIQNVCEVIAPAVLGMEAEDQERIDNEMIKLDDTENKRNLGANAILSVSLSVARAQAAAEKKPLYQYLSRFNPQHNGIYVMPIPQMNIMNGGKHANWATDIQEYMILPIGAQSAREAVRMGSEIYFSLNKTLKKHNYPTNVGDEGGFAPPVKSNDEPFELMEEAVNKAGYRLGRDVFFGIDAAASEFYQGSKYLLKKEGKSLDSAGLIDYYAFLRKELPIVSMEDAFHEDDWEAFRKFTQSVGKNTQIVGDDLYVTNKERLQRGIDLGATNAILIKLNQIGTLTETVEAILLARRHGIAAVVSHRSGETEDPFIADFAIAMGVGQLKAGAPARSERTAKYNRVMEAEIELGNRAEYARFPFKI